jgi:PqqD family protein of HPr-rel-A system
MSTSAHSIPRSDICPAAPPSFACPQGRADLTLHELDDEALIFDPRTADTHRLNATAYEVWALCDGSRSEAEIAGELSERYAIDAGQALEHVARIVEEFRRYGLLVGGGEPAGVRDRRGQHHDE